MGTTTCTDSTSTTTEASNTTDTTKMDKPPNTRKLERAITKKQSVQQLTRIGCWNIRRGLVKRELELKLMLHEEKISIMFLTETDTKAIKSSEDYKIKGYETILQKRLEDNETIRVVCLVKVDMKDQIRLREDLMSPDFPSIWLEMTRNNEKGCIISGFYREWTRNGIRSEEEQLKSMEVFTKQMEQASMENKNMILMGDANICTLKWDEDNFRQKNIAMEIKSSLAQCGLLNMDIGNTYLADRLSEDGTTIESALDHVYINPDIEKRVTVKKLKESSTDHLPIVVELETKTRAGTGGKAKKITRRCMKNFTQTGWKECLAAKRWERLGETEDVEEMAKFFNETVVEALDECAPVKTVIIKPGYKFGLTQQTKALIKERDDTRKAIGKSPNEKKILHEKYKKLRNKVTNEIRKDTIRNNCERIEKADNEKEMWKIVNEVTKPKEDQVWRLKEESGVIEEEKEIAEVFNKFFVEKIEKLKEGIDKDYVKEPLEKLKKKLEKKNLKFSLKTVSEEVVKKAMNKMKKKKSAGVDGISQENLLLGTEILAIPLTRLINCSIKSGIFPQEWKEALVTPILKKGDPQEKKNYRPVSCLAVASKVLEKIVCDQITKFMEKHQLLPNNQHGFRTKRSTMTALSSMQQEWTENTDEKKRLEFSSGTCQQHMTP